MRSSETDARPLRRLTALRSRRVDALGGRLQTWNPVGQGTPLPGGDPTRAMIAEDNVLLREVSVRLLTESGGEVAGPSGNADKLLVLVDDDPPDVAIVDIRVPPTLTNEGMKNAALRIGGHSDVGVLVLSQYVEVGLAIQLLGDSQPE